jgi:hypothetical protein
MEIFTINKAGSYFIFSSKTIQNIKITKSNDDLISKINLTASVPQKFNLSSGDKIYYPFEFLGFLKVYIDETTSIIPGGGDFLSNGDIPMTGNLNFNNNKGINLKAPENDNDAVRKIDLISISNNKADKSDTYTKTEVNIQLNNKQDKIILGDSSKVLLGDLSLANKDKILVGLNNVDNTSDLNKPISSLTQTALDSKVNITEFVSNNESINNLISNKLDSSEFNDFVISNNNILSNKVDNDNYNNYVTSNDLAVASKLNINTFNNQFRNSYYRVRRTGLRQEIANSPTVSINVIPLLQNVASKTGGQIRFLGGGFSNTDFPVLSNSTTLGNYRLPIIPNVEGYTAAITLKLAGTFATERNIADFDANLFISGVTHPLQLNLRRSIRNTAFSGLLDGTFPPIRVDSNTDPLILSTGGFKIELFNNNTDSESIFTLTTLELNVNFI